MASRPACANYIVAITAFVKQFTGGDAFPLLKLLQSIGLSAAARLLASHSKLLQSSHQRLLTQLVSLFLELVALPKPFAHTEANNMVVLQFGARNLLNCWPTLTSSAQLPPTLGFGWQWQPATCVLPSNTLEMASPGC